jgi:hypothetical protein
MSDSIGGRQLCQSGKDPQKRNDPSYPAARSFDTARQALALQQPAAA